MKIKKAVMAYSGGLDTSVAVKWMKDTYGCEVIAYCADLGQEEDLAGIKKKALRTGASKAYVLDLKEEFVKEYVFPMLRANAVYEGAYLMGTSIARPLIAKKQIDIVRKEKADADRISKLAENIFITHSIVTTKLYYNKIMSRR